LGKNFRLLNKFYFWLYISNIKPLDYVSSLNVLKELYITDYFDSQSHELKELRIRSLGTKMLQYSSFMI